jgi:predicted nucleic acid-binding protein
MKTYVVDTNAWIGYFDAETRFKAVIEESILETPASVVAEASIVMRRRGYPETLRKKVLDVIFEKSLILPLERAQAEKVGELVVEKKLHFADAIVYAYSNEEKHVLTKDRDFKGLPNVHFID